MFLRNKTFLVFCYAVALLGSRHAHSQSLSAQFSLKDIADVCSGISTFSTTGEGSGTYRSEGGFEFNVRNGKGITITQSGNSVLTMKDFTYQGYNKCLSDLTIALTRPQQLAQPTKTADLYNSSMSYVNPERGRQIRCAMNNGRCDPRDSRPDNAGPTLILQFGNDGSGAALNVKVEVFVQGVPESLVKSFDRIASKVMVKSLFVVRLPAAPITATCVEYSEESGLRRWVLFAGQAADASGGSMTALLHMADFKKIDDGTGASNGECERQAQVEIAR